MAKPIGAVFWLLSVMTLLLGVGNYMSEFAIRPELQATVATIWLMGVPRDCESVQPEGGYCSVRVEDTAGKFRNFSHILN